MSEMNDTNGNWFKMFRKAEQSQVFQNEGLWKVWCWCLMRASHNEQWFPVKTGRGTTEVHLKPGQFIFGRNAAAKALKMSPETVRSRMLKLKKVENLTIQSTTHYSIVTICNWATYQNTPNQRHQASHQPNTNQTPHTRRKRTKVSSKSIPRKTHIGLLPGMEGCDDAPAGGNGKPKKPTIEEHFEVFWKVVRELVPKKCRKKQGALRRYREAIPKLKAHDDPHAFLTERARAYYTSPEGQTVYASGPEPWLYQGRWDDDPRSWQRDEDTDVVEDNDTEINWG
jgi:hypothetical protein